MTLAEQVAAGRTRLVDAGISVAEAAVDAEVLARAALGWDRARYVADARGPAPGGFPATYFDWIERRAGREPVSLILGRREFWGLEFEVTRDVLTPRPETEGLVQEALACAATLDPRRESRLVIVDVGTGSGCVAVSLARDLPAARILATDISGEALAVARRNAARHEVGDRIAFVRGSLLEPIGRPVDLIVSNPPYVPTPALEALAPEVRDHEPRAALAGGTDGLDVVRALVTQAARALKRGGWLAFEFGDGQEAGARAAVAGQPPLALARVRADLQGIPRTAVVRRLP
jgi:release factor glutamine methyltransferase